MTINSIASQLISAAKYSQVKKPVANPHNKQNDFQDKLQTFRRENRAQRLDTFAKSAPVIEHTVDDVSDKEIEVKIFTPFSGSLLNVSAEDALRTFESKMSSINDFSIQSNKDVRKDIDTLASNYAVYKRHLAQTGSKEQIAELESIFEKTVERYAKSYSDEVGGFYEEKGLAGEKDRMYNAVKDRINIHADSYSQFIANFGEIMDDIKGASEDGVSGIAEGVQAAYKENGDMEIITLGVGGRYTRDALSAAVDLMVYADKLMVSGKASTESEEELGVKLGTIAVEALSFLDTSAAMSAHKEIFLNLVGERLEQVMDESDKLLAKSADKSDSKDAYLPLNRDAIQSIIQKMIDKFGQTKSVTDAVAVGKEKGLRLYLEKYDAESDVKRYQSSEYWESVQQKAEQQRKQYIEAMIKYGESSF